MNIIKHLIIVILVAFLGNLTSCKEDDSPVKPALPVVTTNAVTNVSTSTATTGGAITAADSLAITDRGVCYSTTTAPTLSDEKMPSGVARKNFVVKLANLAKATKYYVRAYATTAAGTVYGNEVIFTTAAESLDVYIGGGKGNQAGYWKNGAYTELTNGTSGAFVTAITASAGVVYAAGYEGNFLTLWVDSEKTHITDGSQVWFAAEDIEVHGSDVYIAGYENGENGRRVAKYWKNGTQVVLTNSANDAEATSIQIVGSDVYVSGYEVTGSRAAAKYWKNGQEFSLTDGTKDAYSSSIFIDGSDVYAAGYERSTADNTGGLIAKYWKNGVATELTNGTSHSLITGITKVGEAVYAVGTTYATSQLSSNAILWNGSETTKLTDRTDAYSSALRIQAVGPDIYVLGKTGDHAYVWKNGQVYSPYDETFGSENLVGDMFVEVH